MADPSQVIVLCEDLQAQVFLRRPLLHHGIPKRAILMEPLPSGGAAGRFVLQRYPDGVLACRTRAARAATAFVAHCDADPISTVAARHAAFASTLAGTGQPARDPSEAIIELVPKRNIETWIHLLLGNRTVNEQIDYPKFSDRERECGPAAEAFADHARMRTSPSPTLPSLEDGLNEFRRLPRT